MRTKPQVNELPETAQNVASGSRMQQIPRRVLDRAEGSGSFRRRWLHVRTARWRAHRDVRACLPPVRALEPEVSRILSQEFLE